MTDTKIYVLVADAGEARCFETTHLGHEMTLVAQFGFSNG